MRLLVLLLLVTVFYAHAVDIDPSRRVIPQKFTNPPGKRFSIFGGDPERVQRANEVNVEDFKGMLEMPVKEFSLISLQNAAEKKETFDFSFRVKNTAGRSYTLSFPDAQRYDFMITNKNGDVIYVWSEDKEFIKEIGKTFMNGREEVIYKPNPPVYISDFVSKLSIGTYLLTAIVSNYPEIKATAEFSILQ